VIGDHAIRGGLLEVEMTDDAAQSPKILNVAWGRVRTEEPGGSFKDAKLYPGGAREWDWGETGTDHRPGVQPVDVTELLDHGATVIVVGCGFHERLQISGRTRQMLRQRGIELHALQTEQAVELYNELRETEPVGALVHSTC
jgi:hypothetical protein